MQTHLGVDDAFQYTSVIKTLTLLVARVAITLTSTAEAQAHSRPDINNTWYIYRGVFTDTQHFQVPECCLSAFFDSENLCGNVN